MDEFQKFFQNFIGLSLHLSVWQGEGSLPLYLSHDRDFRVAEIQGESVLLVKTSADGGVRELKMLRRKLGEASQLPVLFVLENISRVARDAMIQARIEFVALPDQVYMPSLGLLLQNKRAAQARVSVAEKFTPAEQVLFLFLLYHGSAEITKNAAARNLFMPSSSMTRASEKLQERGLLTTRNEGRLKYIKPVAQGFSYYQMAQDCLISPVHREFSTDDPRAERVGIVSGESLVSEKSDLSAPRTPSVCISKNSLEKLQLSEIDRRWQDRDNLIRVEVWRYDPNLFSSPVGADPVSVAASLAGIYDERLEYAIEEMLREALH